MSNPKPKFGFLGKGKARQALRHIFGQPRLVAPRLPQNHQSASKSAFPIQGAVSCDAKCINASHALPAEADQHIIKQLAVKLGSELTALRLHPPSGVPEDHLNDEGQFWKLPQVNFYAASPLYPKLWRAISPDSGTTGSYITPGKSARSIMVRQAPVSTRWSPP